MVLSRYKHQHVKYHYINTSMRNIIFPVFPVCYNKHVGFLQILLGQLMPANHKNKRNGLNTIKFMHRLEYNSTVHIQSQERRLYFRIYMKVSHAEYQQENSKFVHQTWKHVIILYVYYAYSRHQTFLMLSEYDTIAILIVNIC